MLKNKKEINLSRCKCIMCRRKRGEKSRLDRALVYSNSRTSFGCDILPGQSVENRMAVQSKPFLRAVQGEIPAGLFFLNLKGGKR